MKDEKSPNKEVISEELLFRHFSQLTNEEEEAKIADWRQAHDSNQEAYDLFQVFHKDVNAIQSVTQHRKSYDEQEAWKKIQQSQPQIEISKTRTLGPLKIAVSIAIFIAIGWLILINQAPESIQLAAHDKVASVELQDGSEVTLNKGSVLTHPEKFNANERRVIMEGEAYFEIEKDPNRPFIIETGNTTIQVLGTSFNVVEKEGTIEVFVDEGLVKMSSSDEHILLPAGTSGTFNVRNQTLIKQEAVLIETHQFWRNKQLAFKGASLADVMKTLEETYGVSTHFENEQLKNCTITVAFENESIERILRIISTTLNISISQVKNQIQIDGKTSCNN